MWRICRISIGIAASRKYPDPHVPVRRPKPPDADGCFFGSHGHLSRERSFVAYQTHTLTPCRAVAASYPIQRSRSARWLTDLAMPGGLDFGLGVACGRRNRHASEGGLFGLPVQARGYASSPQSSKGPQAVHSPVLGTKGPLERSGLKSALLGPREQQRQRRTQG